MPNDCWNHLSIKGTADQIDQIVACGFAEFPQWAYAVDSRGPEALVCRVWSRERPCLDFMNQLRNNHAGLWIKNTWSEEGGMAGIIVRSEETNIEVEWNEGSNEEWYHRLDNRRFQ